MVKILISLIIFLILFLNLKTTLSYEYKIDFSK